MNRARETIEQLSPSLEDALCKPQWEGPKREEFARILQSLVHVPRTNTEAAAAVSAPVRVQTADVWDLIVGQQPAAQPAELVRWLCQPISLQSAGAMRLGLDQKYSGPCGVLAALNCWLLAAVLFIRPAVIYRNSQKSDAIPATQQAALARLQKLQQQSAGGEKEREEERDADSAEDGLENAAALEVQEGLEVSVLLALEDYIARMQEGDSDVGASSLDGCRSPANYHHCEWCPLASQKNHAPPPDSSPFSCCVCIRATGLAWALTVVLMRCNKSTSTKYLWATVKPQIPLGSFEDVPETRRFAEYLDLEVVEIEGTENLFVFILSEIRQILRSQGGALSFVCSMLLTRSLESICTDMDDSQAGLIGRFGHSSQELVNLILTGEATTNVFDWDKMFGSGQDQFTLKGIKCAQVIGYLSELEALRYCEVGGYYKCPLLPIWIVGSSNHYTIAFSLEPRVADAPRRLEVQLRRAWNEVDPQDCGFISLKQLGTLHQDFPNLSSGEAARALDPRRETGIIVRGEWLEWAVQKLAQRDGLAREPPRQFEMYHYDGKKYDCDVQFRRFIVERDSSTRGEETAASRSFTIVLRTRWTNCTASEIAIDRSDL